MAGEYMDKTLNCVDCNSEFIHTAGQQEFFAQKGFTNEPKRCGPCREARKTKTGSGDRRGGGPKEMFVAKCADCGGEARVPFNPRGDKPVYCSNCFGQRK